MAAAGALAAGAAQATGLPAREIRFRDVTFAYPDGAPVLDGFDLTIPAGSSLAIVGQNGAGKTTLAKLLCRFYDPQAGAIEVDGVDLRDRSTWRRGDRASPPCSRTSCASSCRCATTSRRPARPTTSLPARWPRPAPPTSPASTRCWPAATTAAPTCRAASGSAWRWPARCAR